PQSVKVDLRVLNKQTFVNLSEQLPFLNSQFASSQKVINVKPDTLYFDFTSRAIKRVPVNVLYDIKFRKQYGMADSLHANPAYVTITGPKEEVDRINHWNTDTLRL